MHFKSMVAIVLGGTLLGAAVAEATPTLSIAPYTLLPNTPNQKITLLVSGGDPVTGFNLRAKIGDGGANEPTFESVNFADGSTIWNTPAPGPALTVTGGPVGSPPSYIESSVVLTNTGTSVNATGVLATLTLSTVGAASGSYPLSFSIVTPSFNLPSAFIESGDTQVAPTLDPLSTSTLTVSPSPEPGTLALFAAVAGAGLLRRRRGSRSGHARA